MKFDPSAYAAGDIVKVTETFRVEEAGTAIIWLADIHDPANRFALWPSSTGSGRIEMVKRAGRRKPKTGERLTGKEIGQAKWKRGSVIRCVRSGGGVAIPTGPAIVLFGSGKWHDVAGFGSYEFDDLNEDATFEVLLVA